MFRFAQWIVRHKVLAVAVCAAFFIFTSGGDKENAKPANPWSANVPEQVAVASSPKDASVTSKAFGVVAGAAKKYANVDIGGVNPAKLGETTKQSFEQASDSMKQANGSN